MKFKMLSLLACFIISISVVASNQEQEKSDQKEKLYVQGVSVGVDNLQARFSQGQVFITFDEVSNPNQVYVVYRETQSFTDITNLTPIATLDYGTGVNRFTSAITSGDIGALGLDSGQLLTDLQANGYTINRDAGLDVYIMPPFYALQNASEMNLSGAYTASEKQAIFDLLTNKIKTFVVEDEGLPLTRGTGLLVYTSDSDGDYHYAVTTQPHPDITDGSIVPIQVTETKFEIPGAVLIKTNNPDALGQLNYYFFAWEDYSAWNHSAGYYGHRFNVTYALSADTTGTVLEPLTLLLHSAGGWQYEEPNDYIGDLNARGINIALVDNIHTFGSSHPYLETSRFHAGWFGYEHNGLAVNAAEKRIIRYINFVESDSRFNIDSNRIYITGGSMGGGGSFHTAYHYPHVFAAAAPTIPWINAQAWASGHWQNEFGDELAATPVNSSTGSSFWDWQDMQWIVESTPDFLPPVMHSFNSNDPTISNEDYPDLLYALEQQKFSYAAEWRANGHNGFSLGNNADYTRFRKNEAYPVFANASTSDAINSPLGGGFLTPATGQRNLDLDWSSSLRDLFAGSDDDIIDELDSFRITFQAISVDATADVTIRNAQKFFLLPGVQVTWVNKNLSDVTLGSGTIITDIKGLVTIPAMDILAAGNRLTLSYPDGSTIDHQKLIKRFYFPDINPLPVASVNHVTRQITLSVPSNIDTSNLKALVSHTGSSIQPVSGSKLDFTSPVIFTVSAPDSSIQIYTVTVTQGSLVDIIFTNGFE